MIIILARRYDIVCKEDGNQEPIPNKKITFENYLLY